MSPTYALANRIAKLKLSELDDQTVYRAKYHILDTIGSILAGSQQDVTKIAEQALESAGCTGSTPIIGRHKQTDMLSAAFIAGAAGHGLELDDGYRAGSVHPGTVIIPAALAAGHQLTCSGNALIKAVIAGYEVMCRLAAACNPHARWRGFHNTSTTGVFGAATVWATLQNFDTAHFEHAFGIAASTASGLFTFLYGGDVKRLHPGIAAKNGLLAGIIAEKGLQGPPAVLESKEGFFYAYAGGDMGKFDYDTLDILSVGSGIPWAINSCYIKPYACCRHIHSIIDAIFEIKDAINLVAENVKTVRIGSYAMAVAHDIQNWETFTAAQMSIPFVVATALHNQSVNLSHFKEAQRTNKITIALANKVKVYIDKNCEANYPHLRSAIVTIETIEGQIIERQIDEPLGSPANRLDDSALTAKFKQLATPVIGSKQADLVVEKIWALDTQTNLKPVLNLLYPISQEKI